MKTILILEDNEERIAAFQRAVAALGDDYELKLWRDAHSMRAECEPWFASAALISLDHDLNPAAGSTNDPGTGLDVARFLGDSMPVCPVLLHSSNFDLVYSMHNELRFAGWTLDRIGPTGNDWIERSWLAAVKKLIAEFPNTWKCSLPNDHAERVERMMLSLDGLSIGDALGEMLCYQSSHAPAFLKTNDLPSGPWFHTDDTEMAISLVATLKSHGCVDCDALAKRFVRRFERDPDRGYGSMTRKQLREGLAGAKWQDMSAGAFGGQGSMGNGSAMRVAPLGAYFADDLARLADEVKKSSVVTHMHPEGIAGAVAVAAAAAAAWRLRKRIAGARPSRAQQDAITERAGMVEDLPSSEAVPPANKSSVAAPETGALHTTESTASFFTEVLRFTPESQVKRKIAQASQLPPGTSPQQAAAALGCGELVTAPDTVPFCIWVAARHVGDFVEALSDTIRVGGDCDTNAAIVAGIVALNVGREGIPEPWLKAREPIIF
jgi:ADP-ribosylglycohydrolase